MSDRLDNPHLLLLLLNAVLLFGSAMGAGDWDYKDKGASKWAQLFPQFCAGDRQSPVDLNVQTARQDSTIKKYVVTQEVNGSQFKMLLKNDGHKIELSWSPSELVIKMGISPDRLMYTAAQLHWHWGGADNRGSEHTLNKASYPAEGHLVFYNSLDYASISEAVNRPNGLAVLGVFYELSEHDNPLFSKLDSALSNESLVNATGSAQLLFSKGDLDLPKGFLPAEADRSAFFRYDGSLTTPNCYESVLWTVYRRAVPISRHQLDLLRRLRFTDGSAMTDNYRPPLALNPATRAGTPRTLYRTFAAAPAGPRPPMAAAVAAAVAASVLATSSSWLRPGDF